MDAIYKGDINLLLEFVNGLIPIAEYSVIDFEINNKFQKFFYDEEFIDEEYIMIDNIYKEEYIKLKKTLKYVNVSNKPMNINNIDNINDELEIINSINFDKKKFLDDIKILGKKYSNDICEKHNIDEYITEAYTIEDIYFVERIMNYSKIKFIKYDGNLNDMIKKGIDEENICYYTERIYYNIKYERKGDIYLISKN